MTDKVALITAGGSGMGADAARRLAADGFKVGVLSSSGKGEALAAELGGVGVTGSNQSNDDLKRLVDAAMAQWGRIDVLVNSAGHGPRAPVLELTDEDWHRGMEVYFLNAVRPTRLVTPIMQAQGGGAGARGSGFQPVHAILCRCRRTKIAPVPHQTAPAGPVKSRELSPELRVAVMTAGPNGAMIRPGIVQNAREASPGARLGRARARIPTAGWLRRARRIA